MLCENEKCCHYYFFLVTAFTLQSLRLFSHNFLVFLNLNKVLIILCSLMKFEYDVPKSISKTFSFYLIHYFLHCTLRALREMYVTLEITCTIIIIIYNFYIIRIIFQKYSVWDKIMQ